MPEADETDTVETDTEHTDEETDEAPDGDRQDDEPDDDAETFPRAYVEKLRKENRGYRDRAKTAEARITELERSTDALARQLFTARVAATGKLADPADLAYDADLLDDADKLAAAIDSLIEAKPHLKARKIFGDVGQGVKGTETSTVDLAGMLRARA